MAKTKLGTVVLNQTTVALDRVVYDAWGSLAPPVTSKIYRKKPKTDGRPESSYEDGRVITLREYIVELLASRVDR